MDFKVDFDFDGKSILDFLKFRLGLSAALRKHLKFIENGILLNGAHATVRAVMREGDTLSLALEDSEGSTKLTPVELPLPIVYEDNDLVVPNKPADMPTHPSHDHYEDTVANALAYRYRELDLPFVFRPVNRLDRNTSGAVLIARNRVAAGYLSKALREGKIKKTYAAILCGKPSKTEGEIETYMSRTAESIIVRENCGENEGGDYALTKYKVIATADGYSLALASPITGRTHQLRVHFAGLGCPILGDDLYGEESPLINRHALHALSLSFPLPSTKEAIKVKAPLPCDMQKTVDLLFGEEIREKLLEFEF